MQHKVIAKKICANQLNGFGMMGTLVVKGLKDFKPMMRIFNFLYIFL